MGVWVGVFWLLIRFCQFCTGLFHLSIYLCMFICPSSARLSRVLAGWCAPVGLCCTTIFLGRNREKSSGKGGKAQDPRVNNYVSTPPTRESFGNGLKFPSIGRKGGGEIEGREKEEWESHSSTSSPPKSSSKSQQIQEEWGFKVPCSDVY